MDSEPEMVEIEVDAGEFYARWYSRKRQPKYGEKEDKEDAGGYSLYLTSNQTGKAISMTSISFPT